MAAGLVVISSGTGGAREIIRDGTGWASFSSRPAAGTRGETALARPGPGAPHAAAAAPARRARWLRRGASVEKIERLFEELLLVAPEVRLGMPAPADIAPARLVGGLPWRPEWRCVPRAGPRRRSRPSRRSWRPEPNHAEAHHQLGNALKSLHRYAEAAVSLRAAALLARRAGPSGSTWASPASSSAGSTKAVACFRRAIRLEPTRPEAHNILGTRL